MIEYAIDEGERAECRSVLYYALSLGFRRPCPDTMRRLSSVEGAQALADAAGLLDSTGEYGLSDLAKALANNQDSGDLAGAAEGYSALFGHTARGVVPPYETEYGSDAPFLQPQEFSDIGGFFGAFGLVLDSGEHERIDHVSCLCEFMAFLCEKEAYACAHEDSQMLDETRKGQVLFLRDHLGRFARTFGRRVARQDPLGLYGALGNLCISFIEMECRGLDIPVGPDALQLRTPVRDDSPMACSGCADPMDMEESPNGFDTE